MHENLCLKSENKDLIERTNNLSYVLADLQGKAKNTELEKDAELNYCYAAASIRIEYRRQKQRFN